MPHHPRHRLGAALWCLSVVAILVEPVAAAFVTEPYSFVRQTISDLGNVGCGPVDYPSGPVPVCSPAHAVVNVGWVVVGAAIAVGTVLLRRRLGRGTAGRTAVTLLALSGLLLLGVGLVPADRDLTIHALVAFAGFVVQNLGLLAAWASLRRTDRALATGAAVAGLLGLVAAAGFVAPTAWDLPIGVVERLTAYPVLVWMSLAGAWWLRPPADRGHTEPSARAGRDGPSAAGATVR